MQQYLPYYDDTHSFLENERRKLALELYTKALSSNNKDQTTKLAIESLLAKIKRTDNCLALLEQNMKHKYLQEYEGPRLKRKEFIENQEKQNWFLRDSHVPPRIIDIYTALGLEVILPDNVAYAYQSGGPIQVPDFQKEEPVSDDDNIKVVTVSENRELSPDVKQYDGPFESDNSMQDDEYSGTNTNTDTDSNSSEDIDDESMSVDSTRSHKE